MAIILKLILFIYVLGLAAIQYFLYIQFQESKKTEDYDNSNLFGKIIITLIFIITSSAIISSLIFLFYILLSKITVTWIY